MNHIHKNRYLFFSPNNNRFWVLRGITIDVNQLNSNDITGSNDTVSNDYGSFIDTGIVTS